MSPLVLIGIAVGLSMDAFAVAASASVSLSPVSPRQIFRFAFHFGLFQALMPIIGWMAGVSVQQYIHLWDHWIAFGLLVFVGVKAIVLALRPGEDRSMRNDPTRGTTLVMLSLATSIDALIVGLSFAMLGVRIWTPALVIGVITAGLTWFGMVIGSRLGRRFGLPMEILGGLVLIAIGVKILAAHLA